MSDYKTDIHAFRNLTSDDQNSVCMNGSVHIEKTEDLDRVNCPKCLIKLRGSIEKETRKTIIKLQATLTKISLKVPVFFNITQYKKMGLVREHGKTLDNKTNWILTEKAKQYLKVQI